MTPCPSSSLGRLRCRPHTVWHRRKCCGSPHTRTSLQLGISPEASRPAEDVGADASAESAPKRPRIHQPSTAAAMPPPPPRNADVAAEGVGASMGATAAASGSVADARGATEGSTAALDGPMLAAERPAPSFLAAEEAAPGCHRTCGARPRLPRPPGASAKAPAAALRCRVCSRRTCRPSWTPSRALLVRGAVIAATGRNVWGGLRRVPLR